MKISAACGAIVLATAIGACSPAPASETATPAVPAAIEALPPAPMEPPQIAIPTALLGRWGVTAEACGPSNVPKNGLFEIFPDMVLMGLDECKVTRAEPEGEGVHIVATCRSNIDDEADYERDFSFVSSSPDTMTWITEGGTPEPYVRCP
jgi:hypothetical protein